MDLSSRLRTGNGHGLLPDLLVPFQALDTVSALPFDRLWYPVGKQGKIGFRLPYPVIHQYQKV